MNPLPPSQKCRLLAATGASRSLFAPDTRAALADKETVDGLAVMGLEAKSSTPAELAALLWADTERWGPIVKAVGITAES